MAVELGTTWEREDLGSGKFRHTVHLRPICYSDGGTLRRIVSNWGDGDATFPHACLGTLMPTYMAGDGTMRICPTREANVWVEIGGPYLKPAAQWNKVNLGTATRSGNVMSWSTAQADVRVTQSGHFVKIDIPLKGGWQPPNGQVAFPVGMQGLTRTGSIFYKNGVPVMTFRPPNIYDAANHDDVRRIAYDIVKVGNQWYVLLTLPSLTGMTSPVIDPSPLILQPDAAAGIDTSMTEANPDYNRGIATTINVGGDETAGMGYRGLLSFDISALPGGVTLTSGSLALYCESEASSDDYTVYVNRALTQWYEGNQPDWVLDPGVDGSTWNYRNNNGTVAWAGGAGGASGSDWTAGATASQLIDTVPGSFTFNVLTDVQAWYGGTANNYGWWLLLSSTDEDTANSRKRFTSSDGVTATNRPKLTVEYSAAGNPWYAYAQQ